jgi:hypothetical protein
MNLFKNANTKEKAKERYNQLSKIYHPDAGKEPDGEMFVELTKQYKKHLEGLENPTNKAPKTENPIEEPKAKEPIDELNQEFTKRMLKLTPKQKKNLVKGSTLLFSVFADKIVDRFS